jgi:hypothetical protein
MDLKTNNHQRKYKVSVLNQASKISELSNQESKTLGKARQSIGPKGIALQDSFDNEDVNQGISQRQLSSFE